MPFRERAKNLFKTKSRSDSVSKSSSTTNSDSANNPTSNNKSSKDNNRDRYPSNVYAPDEPMPKPKYRLPPKKEHKEKLESFNFADAWRKRSFQSSYSPMGTRAPSRRNSFLSKLGGGSSSRLASRANSVASDGATTGVNGVRRSSSVTSAGAAGAVDGNTANNVPTSKAALLHPNAAMMETQPEAEGDDDITNVGLSRVQSRSKAHPDTSSASKPTSAQQRRPNINGVVPPGVTAHDHQPFSEQELQLAMQRSHMTVTAQS